jgi:ABC-type polysaccharide/polyol phosphate transport system ATPase subunit
MSAASSAPNVEDAPAAGIPAVVVDRVSKTFKIPHHKPHTLKERVLHPLRRPQFDRLEALREVSVEVAEGEFFGIVGRNGSGKSTLLKCLAGIYEPSAGEVSVRGRLATFIELGVGFNPELTARDNVLINGTMMGLSRREAAARFDEVIAFAELEEFVDLKLKNYSSGMHVRLAFASAVQVDAEVLLVDEVLAVGDAAFQQKCFDEFQRMKDEGRTILFVTHDMASVERFCDRAMLLESGRIVSIGQPGQIGREYNELNFGRAPEVHVGEVRAGGRREGEIVSLWVEQPAGEPTKMLASGERAAIAIELWTREPIEDPVVTLIVRNGAHIIVFAPSSEFDPGFPTRLEADRRYVVRLHFDCLLAPGRYELTPTIARRGGLENVIDLREGFGSTIVHSSRPNIAVTDLPHTFELTST